VTTGSHQRADPGHRRAVGLTERTVQAIVADLEAAGYLIRARARLDTVSRKAGGIAPCANGLCP
jgi:hypothetical protein